MFNTVWAEEREEVRTGAVGRGRGRLRLHPEVNDIARPEF